MSSFEIIKNNDYNMVLIENYPCNNRDELYARERHYIEQNECVNKVIPIRTIEEFKDIKKDYYVANKEKIIKRVKTYNKVHKDNIKVRQKEYYQNNKESYKEMVKQYQLKNKEAIKAKRTIKHDCVCGMQYTLQGKTTHLRSKKHISFINNQNN